MLDVFQQTHPDVEGLRQKFVVVVEAAEDESAIRQSRLGPARCALRDLAFVVGGEIGVGKMDHRLAVVAAVGVRNDGCIGDEIVDRACAQSAGKSEVADLHGRRPEREDLRAAFAGISHQVDGDIDLHFAQQARGGEVVHVADFDEAIECSLKTAAPVARFSVGQ